MARRIFQISTLKNAAYGNIELDETVKLMQTKNKIIYDETQTSAIKRAVSSKFSIITGGAGVGKATITKVIFDIFKSENKKIILAAPTGRAARRLTEMCKIESKTTHRLLLEAGHGGKFSKNEQNKLIGDMIIIDESSMIDIILMYNLLKAIPNEMTVIMTGDADQLPWVGAVNVLNDIINSNVLPGIRINKIYRQAEFSKIITNSHKINSRQMPDLEIKNNSDFFHKRSGT